MQQALGFLMHCQSPSPLLYSERVREERPKKETSKMTNTWLPHAPSVTLSTALLREREREREGETETQERNNQNYRHSLTLFGRFLSQLSSFNPTI